MEADVPLQSAYVLPIAAQYGTDDCFEEESRRRKVDGFQQADIAALAALHDEIRRRGDAHRLSAWVWANDAPGKRSRAWWSVRILFLLFAELGSRGVDPFISSEVRLSGPPREPLDWSKLPARLAYLAAPAVRYGTFSRDDEVDAFCKFVSPAELDELAQLARRIVCDASEIEAWLDRWPMTDHRESALVYFMQGIIDRLGLFG